MSLNRIALIGLNAFVAVGAVGGGIGLMFYDGLGMSVDQLDGTPFSSYVIPGMILLLAVGGSALVAAWALMARHEYAAHLAFIAAAVLAGWIIVQIAMLGFIHFLQPVFFILGLIMMVFAIRFWQEHSYRRI
jgi:hypothetical protein